MPSLLLLLPLTLLLPLLLALLQPLHTDAAMDLTDYQLTFSQDFTALSNLSVSAWGPNTTWIAHKPDGEDWCNFEDPHGYLRPFGLVNRSLAIRSYGDNGTLRAGLLSSVDGKGVGFSQRYGYFEMMGMLPKGPGTWPAFWLEDVTALVNRSMDAHEIDVLEQYGDAIGILRTTLHYWSNNASHDWGQGWAAPRCSMTEGMHSYGFDMQPDVLTFYYDRQMILQVPNAIPGNRGTYDRPMFLMVNLAYGGGGAGNNVSYILGHPQLMYVQYVKAWQGSGGSARANDTSAAPALYYWTAGLTLVSPARLDFLDRVLLFNADGNLQVAVAGGAGRVLWSSNFTGVQCGKAGCQAVFQNDGNLVLHDGTGAAYYATGTYGDNEGSMTVQAERPYIKIYDGDCGLLWSTDNETAWYRRSDVDAAARTVVVE